MLPEALHGLRFAPHEALVDGVWGPTELIDNKMKKSAVKMGSKGLTLSRHGAYYDGVKLANPRWNAVTNTLSVGGPGHTGPIGNLHLNDDFTSYVGYMASSANATPQVVRAVNTKVTYSTQIEKDGQWVKYETLIIGTQWTSGPHPALTNYVMLGDTDVSDRCAVVKVDNSNWTTVFKMSPSLNAFMPDKRAFVITITMHPGHTPVDTFLGKITDSEGKEYPFRGESVKPKGKDLTALNAHVELLSYNPEEDPTATERPTKRQRGQEQQSVNFLTMASSSDLSLMDLVSLSSLQPNGDKPPVDVAQSAANQYMQNMLVNSLDQKWIDKLYGEAPYMNSTVTKIQQNPTNLKWLKKQAVPNMAQLLTVGDHSKNDLDAIKKINRKKIHANYDTWGKSKIFSTISNQLYLEGYLQNVPGMKAYVDDKTNWGQAYYDYIIDDYLPIWAVQITSSFNTGQNIKSKIYQIYVKLQLLCPDHSNLPSKALSTLLSTLLNIQANNAKWDAAMGPYLQKAILDLKNGVNPFKDAITAKSVEEQKKIVSEMISITDNILDLSDTLGEVIASATRRKNKKIAQMTPEELASELENENPGFFKKLIKKFSNSEIGKCLKVLFYAGGAGYILYTIIGGHNDILTDINLSLFVAGMLVKSVEKLLATRLGKWLSEKMLQEGEDGLNVMQRMFKNFTQWFTKEGVEEGSWAARIFGKSSAEFFANRLGPILSVVGIAVAGYFLYKAIETGDVPDIIFNSLMVVQAVLETVFVGLELAGFAWAGPAGLIIAAIGVIIMVVQLFYDLFHPATPPPDPVQQFINGPVKDAGYAS